MGREHTREGLMRASLGARDLLDPGAVRLPRGWMAGAPGSVWLCRHVATRRLTHRLTECVQASAFPRIAPNRSTERGAIFLDVFIP